MPHSAPVSCRCTSGQDYTIVSPTAEDVASLVALMNALASERNGLFIVPVDPIAGAAQLQAHLTAAAAGGNEAILVARLGSDVVGLVSGTRGTHPARRGIVDVGIGVSAEWRGRGIGSALLGAVEDWASISGIHRLQLTVITSNAQAVALYRRLGYAIEGIMCAHAERDGSMFDEFVMAKILSRRHG